jgi:hypothetical protein
MNNMSSSFGSASERSLPAFSILASLAAIARTSTVSIGSLEETYSSNNRSMKRPDLLLLLDEALFLCAESSAIQDCAERRFK